MLENHFMGRFVKFLLDEDPQNPFRFLRKFHLLQKRTPLLKGLAMGQMIWHIEKDLVAKSQLINDRHIVFPLEYIEKVNFAL